MQSNRYELIDTRVGFTPMYIARIVIFIAGIFVLALGAGTLIRANLGVATWDVLHIGLSDISGLSVGRWVQIVGVTMVLMTSFFEKIRPSLASIINIVLVGFFLNLILDYSLVPSFDSTTLRALCLVIGIILMGLGSGMYVSTRIGAGPRDGMTLFLAKRFSISVRLSRTILEVSALTLGWLVGGPVSFGTIICIPIVGPVMQTSMRFWTCQLNKLSRENPPVFEE